MNSITNTSKNGLPKTNVNNSEPGAKKRNQTNQVASQRIQAANPRNPKEPKKNRQVESLSPQSPPFKPSGNAVLTPSINKPSEPKEPPKLHSLENSQKIILNSMLDKIYLIPGKNGAPDLQLRLLDFLRELQHRLPYAHIKLIGSAAGYVVCPQIQGYNDLDFVIEIQLPYDIAQNASKNDLQWYTEQCVKDICNQTREILETCLATQLRDDQTLIDIANNYFNKQKVKNSPIDLTDIYSPTDNRCSIIGFGDLEFKTVINVFTVEENTPIGIIPGLKNPSAFDRDDIGIGLSHYLKLPSFQWLDYPLYAMSTNVPIQTAIDDLKSKELCTTRICGSKCTKGIDNITFKGCFYTKEETNRAIYIQFLENPSSVQDLIKHFHPYEEERLFGILCALSNFCINGANLGFHSTLMQPFHQTLATLASKYFNTLPGDLLLKWFQLSLFLSAKPAIHSSHLLSLIDHEHTYYILKPKCPADLLIGFMQELQKHPEISLKDLPILGVPFATVEDLFFQMKPYLKEEEHILFDHCLLSQNPSALDKEQDVEFKWILLLLETLINLPSPETRQELIQKTKECFELRGSNCVELFENLNMRAAFNPLHLGTLFYASIKTLITVDPDLAERLWDYAEEVNAFADSPIDRLKAFACVYLKKEEDIKNKNEIITALKKTVQVMRDLSQSLGPESLIQLDSFDALLLTLAYDLSKENLDQEDLKFIQNLFIEIAPLSFLTISFKKEMAKIFFQAFTTLATNDGISANQKKKQQAILNIFDQISKMYSKEDGKEFMRFILKYLKACPNGTFIAQKYITNPHFKSVLIEEMQEGTLENNIAWFTLLRTHMSHNDQESWKCCSALLKQWCESPSLTHYESVLPAFQLLNNAAAKKGPIKQTDTSTLKSIAISSYFSFIKGCLKNGDQKLIHLAEGILQNNAIKDLSPETHATLVSDLICSHFKIESAEKLLVNAVQQKIFNPDTRFSWIRAICGILNSHINSNRKVQFIEKILNDSSMLSMLLDPTTKNANDLITLIIEHCGQIQSKIKIETFTSLFKQMYENRKTNNDPMLDLKIQNCTTILFTYLNVKKLLSLKQWGELITTLQNDKNVFIDMGELKEEVLGIAVRASVSMVSEHIQNNHSKVAEHERCRKLLSVYESAQKNPLHPADLFFCQNNQISALILLKDIPGAIAKLELITDPISRTNAIKDALSAFIKSRQELALHNSKETARLFEMLEELSQIDKVDKIFSLDTFGLCVVELIKTAGVDNPKLHHNQLDSLIKKLGALLESHRHKFSNWQHTYNLFISALQRSPLFQLCTGQKIVSCSASPWL